MSHLFSPDSRIPAALSRVADLVVLNLLFLLTCIPLFTIGPALSALYTVTFAFGTHREQGVAGTYFRAFRQNFWQACIFLLHGFLPRHCFFLALHGMM